MTFEEPRAIYSFRLFTGLALAPALAVAAPMDARAQEFTVEARPVDDLKAVFAMVASLDTTLARSRIAYSQRGEEVYPIENA